MPSTDHTERLQAPHDEPSSGSGPAANQPMSIPEIQASYAEYADWLHRFELVDRAVTGRYRRDRFGDVSGRVLDVACGTGTNFRYLPETVDLVGIDISPEMLANAEEQLAALERDGTLQRMDAQELAFPDDSFDAVISALSTCTFPDPVAALQEMERVCKPEGTIRLVEHGRSDVGPLARYQEWRAEAHYAKMGCRWTQEPTAVVADAGLSVRDTTSGLFGTITTFEIDPR
ncbi:class I SAM-dependent methyltransferase [Halomarina salina]|uniref:Class I SAM-dependent methyltransferase n=1 Tax=Halomarina salina TaxID=1872699 RepID=A0ABD5RSX4_9EURY|nr:class I SAM-dependent methyltransferase [Halomarina salina]